MSVHRPPYRTLASPHVDTDRYLRRHSSATPANDTSPYGSIGAFANHRGPHAVPNVHGRVSLRTLSSVSAALKKDPTPPSQKYTPHYDYTATKSTGRTSSLSALLREGNTNRRTQVDEYTTNRPSSKRSDPLKTADSRTYIHDALRRADLRYTPTPPAEPVDKTLDRDRYLRQRASLSNTVRHASAHTFTTPSTVSIRSVESKSNVKPAIGKMNDAGKVSPPPIPTHTIRRSSTAVSKTQHPSMPSVSTLSKSPRRSSHASDTPSRQETSTQVPKPSTTTNLLKRVIRRKSLDTGRSANDVAVLESRGRISPTHAVRDDSKSSGHTVVRSRSKSLSGRHDRDRAEDSKNGDEIGKPTSAFEATPSVQRRRSSKTDILDSPPHTIVRSRSKSLFGQCDRERSEDFKNGDEFRKPTSAFEATPTVQRRRSSKTDILDSPPLRSVSQKDSVIGLRELLTMRCDKEFDFIKFQFSRVSPRKKVTSGLSNIGNTCFMAAALQCLFSTEPLAAYFLSDGYRWGIDSRNSAVLEHTESSPGPLALAFGDLIKSSYERGSSSDRPVVPAAFKKIVEKRAPQFVGYDQQDAQEFLTFLLDGLHDDLSRVAMKPKFEYRDEDFDALSNAQKALVSWNRTHSYNNSIISDLFQGQLESTVTCTRCNTPSVTYDAFWGISLPIPKSDSCSLEDCLREYSKEELLGEDEKYMCSKCKERERCTKKIKIYKLPTILVIRILFFSKFNSLRGRVWRKFVVDKSCFDVDLLFSGGISSSDLKRFLYTSFSRNKLETDISYPCNRLALDEFLSVEKGSDFGQTYELYATINHGGGLGGGHYTAICRQNGNWYLKNDANSKESDVPTNREGRSPYVLFYSVKKNTAVGRL